MVDWPSYNLSLVRHGEILFSYDFLDSWGYELVKMNKSKKGKPFTFPDSFIKLLVTFVHHFIYLTDKQRVLSRLQENVCYYLLIRVMVISAEELTS